MKKIVITLVCLCALGMIGCTGNQRAKKFGGKTTEHIEQGHRVVNVTWKDNNLWILTRPADPGESARVLTLKESSSFGIIEGQVNLVEH